MSILSNYTESFAICEVGTRSDFASMVMQTVSDTKSL